MTQSEMFPHFSGERASTITGYSLKWLIELPEGLPTSHHRPEHLNLLHGSMKETTKYVLGLLAATADRHVDDAHESLEDVTASATRARNGRRIHIEITAQMQGARVPYNKICAALERFVEELLAHLRLSCGARRRPKRWKRSPSRHSLR